MTLKFCLRCDWKGETKEPTCPNCGTRPLYLAGGAPSAGARVPRSGHPEERSQGTPTTASMAPSGTASPRSTPSPSPTDAVGSSSRSARTAIAFVLPALVLTVALGTWLKAHEEPSGLAASTDAALHESPATGGSPTPVVSPSLSPSATPRPSPSPSRYALTVDGVPFSFSVPTSGWERKGDISINKSIVGPQGAEAIIFWTSFPDGLHADPCVNLQVRPLVHLPDLAAAISTAPGTELVRGPSDVTVGGRAAKHVVLTVREDAGCDPGFFFTWHDRLGGALWPRTSVGDTISVWIVDVDGTRLFIEAETNKHADSDLEQEIQQIVGSIRFD